MSCNGPERHIFKIAESVRKVASGSHVDSELDGAASCRLTYALSSCDTTIVESQHDSLLITKSLWINKTQTSLSDHQT